MGRALQWAVVRRSILAFRGGDRANKVLTGSRWLTSVPLPHNSGNWRLGEINRCDSRWGQHCFTTSSDFRVKEADTSIKHVPIKVGAELSICLAGSNTDVEVVTGDNLEEIVLEARWKAGQRSGDWSDFQLIETSNYVKLQKIGYIQGHGGGPALEGSVSVEAVKAFMPARWCSLSVEARQNPVRIQSLREGNLNVETFGGHVTLGDMRGGVAKILTNGGCFTADLVSADSVIKTMGGDVSIKRLVGNTIDMDAGGGDIYVGSLYGNDVVMKSSGGSFEAKHIQAKDSALVSTDGGSVQITGIDGKARIVTSGGAVSLQLHEHAREIDIEASEGSVTLFFSNNLSAQVEYNGGRDIEQSTEILSATPRPGEYIFVGQDTWGEQDDYSRANRSEETIPEPRLCKIRIHSSGSLQVKMRSWIDVAMASTLPSFVK